MTIDAVQQRIQARMPLEFERWREAFLVFIEVDGAPWDRGANGCGRGRPFGRTSGPWGSEMFYASCVPEADDRNGLPQGSHSVRIRAIFPATGLIADSGLFDVELDCARAPKLKSTEREAEQSEFRREVVALASLSDRARETLLRLGRGEIDAFRFNNARISNPQFMEQLDAALSDEDVAQLAGGSLKHDLVGFQRAAISIAEQRRKRSLSREHSALQLGQLLALPCNGSASAEAETYRDALRILAVDENFGIPALENALDTWPDTGARECLACALLSGDPVIFWRLGTVPLRQRAASVCLESLRSGGAGARLLAERRATPNDHVLLEPLLKWLSGETGGKGRELGLRILARFDPDEAVNERRRIFRLAATDPALRETALEGLLELGLTPEDLRLYLDIIHDPSSKLRGSLLWGRLLAVDDDWAVPVLAQCLATPEYLERAECARRLADLDRPETVPQMMSVLETAPRELDASAQGHQERIALSAARLTGVVDYDAKRDAARGFSRLFKWWKTRARRR